MKLNKKGFAVSSIIYSILILFLMLIFGLLSILGSRKLIFDKTKNDVMNKLNGDVVEKEPEVEGKDLAQTLLRDCSETNTVGLIRDTDGSCYYKGTNEEVANNFVWVGGHLWRVISINEDNTLTMITQQPVGSSGSQSGWINEDGYKEMLFHKWINETFLPNLDIKDKLQETEFNIGKYSNVEAITTKQYAGYLDFNQYARAGGEKSFLNIGTAFLLGNVNDSDRSGIILSNGTVGSIAQFYGFRFEVRPIIRISNISVILGDGSLSNPYREKSTTTSTSNVQVGEYISVPTSGLNCGDDNKCLFRVVAKDDDSIKVTLNGLISTSAFDLGNSSFFSSKITVFDVLSNFAEEISEKYRYIGAKNFNIHTVGLNEEKNYEGNIGLPLMDELFSSNDINLTYPSDGIKSFVNVNTIENPILASKFWLMNPNYHIAGYTVQYINYNGESYDDNASRIAGVRPVLFLNNNLTFTGGEGTAENPFTLE